MLFWFVLQTGHSVDVCELGDLFVLSWVRRVRQGSVSSELIMCGGSVHIIVLLPFVAMCIETQTIDACISCKFVFMLVVVTVWGLE